MNQISAGIPERLALQLTVERLVYDLNAEIFVCVGSLLEDNWTGIPVVTASLIEVLMACLGPRLKFFFREDEIAQEVVWEALARSTGLFLNHEINHLRTKAKPIRRSAPGNITIGISAQAKFSRGIFDYECSIIHDLSTLITPQYHVYENIAHHMETIAADIATNAVTACVSSATAEDLKAYLGVPADRLVVAYNGISWRENELALAETGLAGAIIEPFFLIVGTREPRKNNALIFELLNAFPELLNTHRFVITGKLGWLQEKNAVPEGLRGAIESGRILFTDFISEAEKCRLLMAAEATIYPSFFEGFGLPVVESLSLGTPCIVSSSSSLPEVGGAHCFYFDPFSVLDLHRAITDFKRAKAQHGGNFRQIYRESVARFTWTGMALAILQALEGKIAA